jgi:hypothetical protein
MLAHVHDAEIEIREGPEPPPRKGPVQQQKTRKPEGSTSHQRPICMTVPRHDLLSTNENRRPSAPNLLTF